MNKHKAFVASHSKYVQNAIKHELRDKSGYPAKASVRWLYAE